MTYSNPAPIRPPLRSRAAKPPIQFGGWALAGLALLVGVVALVFDVPGFALSGALGFYGVGVTLAAFYLHRDYPHGTLGLCNAVTLARLVVVAVLIAPLLAGSAVPWLVFALAAVALALDGLDGWLARREGRVSDFGARFDMEVDSTLALVLALHAWQGGSAGAVVLMLGLPRYGFVVAGWVLPWLNGPLPERFSRKVVCVAQLSVLIALQLPFIGGLGGGVLATGAALALVWSFALDIRHLWRAQP